jgi:hypothetical protein
MTASPEDRASIAVLSISKYQQPAPLEIRGGYVQASGSTFPSSGYAVNLIRGKRRRSSDKRVGECIHIRNVHILVHPRNISLEMFADGRKFATVHSGHS